MARQRLDAFAGFLHAHPDANTFAVDRNLLARDPDPARPEQGRPFSQATVGGCDRPETLVKGADSRDPRAEHQLWPVCANVAPPLEGAAVSPHRHRSRRNWELIVPNTGATPGFGGETYLHRKKMASGRGSRQVTTRRTRDV